MSKAKSKPPTAGPNNVIKLVASIEKPAPVEQQPPAPVVEWLELHVDWSLFLLEQFDKRMEVRDVINDWEITFLENMS
jgi:hypothetical protein